MLVSRWFSLSQLCSTCGFSSGRKPLHIRFWTCPLCEVAHDRDVNAAGNILAGGRKVAAGLTEALTARGGSRRPGLVWHRPMKREPAEALRQRHVRTPAIHGRRMSRMLIGLQYLR